MKVGLSTYSLSRAINAKEMDVLGAIRWIAENGGEQVELSPSGYSLTGNPELVKAVVKEAAQCGLAIASYTIGANFIKPNLEEYKAEIKRIKDEVDIGGALGVKCMRHDAGSRKPEEATVANFEKDLPGLVEACGTIADHAKKYGITTSVENHGYHVQGSERVQRLVLGVNRPNFRTTLDVGNFLCADEDPIAAVKNNIGIASHIHFKDFYVRERNPGEGWFRSRHGRYLRGAIVGQGDVAVPEIIKIIRDSGYDGFVSIEFEGMEECKTGSRIGMQNVRRLWDEAAG
jgi:sugar phosphate isomerase/epimerase